MWASVESVSPLHTTRIVTEKGIRVSIQSPAKYETRRRTRIIAFSNCCYPSTTTMRVPTEPIFFFSTSLEIAPGNFDRVPHE